MEKVREEVEERGGDGGEEREEAREEGREGKGTDASRGNEEDEGSPEPPELGWGDMWEAWNPRPQGMPLCLP